MGAEATDRTLLAAVAAGEPAALGALYDRYAARALGLAHRIVADSRAAEEVVRDAFVTVWRRAGSYRPERGEPGAWLLSIVHDRAIDRRRGAGAAARADLDLTALAGAAADGDDRFDEARRLERDEIAAALAALPAEQREPIELAFFGGLTHVEIAASTSLPTRTVKGRVRLGLLRLRRHLQRQSDPPGHLPRRATTTPIASPSTP